MNATAPGFSLISTELLCLVIIRVVTKTLKDTKQDSGINNGETVNYSTISPMQALVSCFSFC